MMASPCKPPSSVPIKFPSGSYIGANPVRVFIQNRITKAKHIRTYRIILFRQRILTKPAEGIVIVAFQHFAIVVDYRTYAAEMVGHEITGFDTRSCRYKTTAREGATLHRQGSAMLGIYQRTRVVKTVARRIRRRELGTYLKDTNFLQQSYRHALLFRSGSAGYSGGSNPHGNRKAHCPRNRRHTLHRCRSCREG